MQFILRNNRAALFIVLLLLAAVSRIPLLGPDRALLDGDEALMGLMSFHQLEKEEFPVYFWGQNYGLSTLEVSAISLFHLLIGPDDLAVKLGMLLIWLLAVSGAWLLLCRYLNPWMAFWLGLFFVLHPVWFHWSLKARGGYLTAFALSNWALWLAGGSLDRSWKHLLTGLLLALCYQAHKLWFLPTLLVLLALVIPKWRDLVRVLGSAAVFFAGFYILSRNYPDFWKPTVVDLSLWKSNLVLIPKRLLNLFQGNYFLGDIHPVNLPTTLAALAFLLLGGAGIGMFGWRVRREGWKMKDLLWLAGCFSPLGVLLIAADNFGLRYLLPFPFLLLLWTAVQLSALKSTGPVFFRTYRLRGAILFLPLCLLAFAGSLSLKDTGHYAWMRNERRDFKIVTQMLLDEGIYYVFSDNRQAVWQFMYYSHERIIASWQLHTDRYPEFPVQVRQACTDGLPSALLSPHPHPELGIDSLYQPIHNQFIIRNPSQEVLLTMGFGHLH